MPHDSWDETGDEELVPTPKVGTPEYEADQVRGVWHFLIKNPILATENFEGFWRFYEALY